MHRPGSVLWGFIDGSVKEAGLSPDIQHGGRNEQALPSPFFFTDTQKDLKWELLSQRLSCILL